ncbi:signal peptide peptidase SppA [Oceanidesulfovibrio indonesiensis]|uniref:Signal peptide peptidase SppA n=1 Tax=Oceanidesulfovibrio indonesiensis TaxID=54767 RepID=A0A7M3MBI3_9BACT|nr:signal peptide peptidase SppA [Oceanidesulfovibrio indonesiensis]TVM15542.1 signal peptide peptidase SppA [Oceanidesulfovibrio indonesiensis]
MVKNSGDFSQRHPFLFGFAVLAAVVVFMIGAMAAVRFLFLGGEGGMTGKRYGLVRIEGPIIDAEPVVEFITGLRDDSDVAGVLIRVDSPGGVVGPAQEIHAAVKETAAVKPVVVSMGSVAASGGYYVACPAHKIVANPGTLTGSIGVIMTMGKWKELMDRIGLTFEAITSGEMKDAGSPYRELTPKERLYFQNLVDDLHDQFVTDVADGRSMDIRKVRELADGRIYTGRQARESGLVDEMGGFEVAKDMLRAMTGKGNLPFDEGPVKDRGLLDMLIGVVSHIDPGKATGPRFEYTVR